MGQSAGNVLQHNIYINTRSAILSIYYNTQNYALTFIVRSIRYNYSHQNMLF